MPFCAWVRTAFPLGALPDPQLPRPGALSHALCRATLGAPLLATVPLGLKESLPRRGGGVVPPGAGGSSPPPKRVKRNFMATQRSARPFSPPLAEWPRLEYHPPPFGRYRYYEIPATSNLSRASRPRFPEASQVGPFGDFQPRVIDMPPECRFRDPRFECRSDVGSSS
ncbi:unnamed protein product [Parnassius apollo]|uniref:(apollo) hypothetical protein n=1 Tax=Parnassius apollo TaxID=110799 RepID=A0A8S3XNG0_PARAO|nr:unnamed protein product [Parnassius apollo]